MVQQYPALSGTHIQVKQLCIHTTHATASISSTGFIYILNISGNFFFLPWSCQRYPIHHCKCEDLIPATACVASEHWWAENQLSLINRVPVYVVSWVPFLSKHSPAASCVVMHLDLPLLYNKWEIKGKQKVRGLLSFFTVTTASTGISFDFWPSLMQRLWSPCS